MDVTETVEITSPVLQVNDTQTSKLVPPQGSVTTSVPSTFLPDDLGSTTPMMPTEDSAVTVTETVPVSTMESLSTESETVASIPNVTSEIPRVSDIVVTIPSTEAYVSSVATETIPSTEELATAPLSTSEIPDTNMSAMQTPSVPTVISTAMPELIGSTATTTTAGTTTDVPEPDLAMTTDTAVPVISTGPQTGQTDPPTVTTASTPRLEVSTLPPSVIISESGGTTFPVDPFNTTRSPDVAGATTPKSTSPGLPGYVLLGSAGMPDWRLYLIMVSVIALALIMIMLIGWIITCVCMRVSSSCLFYYYISHSGYIKVSAIGGGAE
ncbi:unnamed protein product [Dibothriocephalus latus]|uniref:Uncharacterized protein n=1 Tax=Dibothriocephalus latus TaxID=60516 RepID=A0A3P7LI98_DIBLA|nr:unnamed protein product [Dibothriocephalus latus]